MSKQHIWYLKSCWPPALQNSHLLRSSDIMVYLNAPREQRPSSVQLLNDTFSNHNLTIQVRDSSVEQEVNKEGATNVTIIEKRQAGAMAALSEATAERWFDGYDWVIRVNPDVIIRNDTFLIDTMIHDPSATAMLIDCHYNASDDGHRLKVHTDFFMIRPSVLPADAFLEPSTGNAEYSFTHDIDKAILKKGNHRWIPGADPVKRACRAGDKREMRDTPITHFHVKNQGADNYTCMIPFL